MKQLFLKISSINCCNQKQPPEVFYKKGVLKNFAIFTGKHLSFYWKHMSTLCIIYTIAIKKKKRWNHLTTPFTKDYHCTRSYPYSLTSYTKGKFDERIVSRKCSIHMESKLKISFFVWNTRLNYATVIVKNSPFEHRMN